MAQRSQTAKPLRVIIAGGGTGGHVFPAIAIAKAITKHTYNAGILFVGAKRRLEMSKVPEAGFHIIGLDIAGLQRRLTWKNLLLPWKIIKSLNGANKIVKRFKPDIVIGVGGYASGPVLWAAAKQKIPVLIQEQNSFPGLTNRILGKKATKICVAYEGMDKYFPQEKIYLTGNPVRHDVVDIQGKREKAFAYFGLDKDKPTILSTGGSLGARSINESIYHHLDDFSRAGIQLIWQTGEHFYEVARKKLGDGTDELVRVMAFIDRMDYAYAAADLIISRSGAIAVSEICAVRKPVILVPSPNVAEDHQTKNAMALVNHHAAVLVRDAEAMNKLSAEAIALVQDENKMHRLKEKMTGLSYRDAAGSIAGMAIEMIQK